MSIHNKYICLYKQLDFNFFLSPIQDGNSFFCNNLSLGKDRILDSESAQNSDLETIFFEWPPSKV